MPSMSRSNSDLEFEGKPNSGVKRRNILPTGRGYSYHFEFPSG